MTLRSRVLVIGGGPVGLVVSAVLADRGIANIVLERRHGARRAPAAHVLRRRSMEVFDALGVGDEVRSAASPLALDFVTWCTTLGGSEIGRLELRPVDPRSGVRGPEPWTNCSQDRLEPVLLRAVEARADAQLMLGTQCLALEQTPQGVVARTESGETIEAAWAVAADGAASGTRRALGIAMDGPGPLARFSMVHFAADLRPWIRDRSGPIFWILNPESPGALIVHDPARSHVLMLPRAPARPGAEHPAASEQEISAQLAAALGVPVRAEILSIDAWSPHVQVAERYRSGRVFLVGDAAHRFPPTGGLGLNTGIAEAWWLADALARVEAGEAGDALLDDYDASCRPAARANADASFENLRRLAAIGLVLGRQPDLAALERRLASLTQAERGELARAIEAQRSHFLCDGAVPGESGQSGESGQFGGFCGSDGAGGTWKEGAMTKRPEYRLPPAPGR